MSSQPFDEPIFESAPAKAEAAPVVQTAGDNWVSFSFVSGAGYDRVQGTVHGTPQFVADKFGIKDFDGKISALMKQATAISLYWQEKPAAKEAASGKADAPVGKPGQPAGSLKAPEWAGDAPTCEHGKLRRYKSLMKTDGSAGHLWECTAVAYPTPGQCPAVWINKPGGK